MAVAGRAICGTLEVAGVQLRVDYGKWVDAAGAQNWTWKLDTSKLKNGRHTLQARASDGMGYSDTVDRTITVDNPGPGGKGFIPGFDALPLLIAAAALLVLRRKTK